MFSKILLLFLLVNIVWSEEPNSYVQINVINNNDYSYIETGKSFYKLHTSAMTWADAKRACVQEGAILWHPDNDDEMHAVISFWDTTLPKLVFVGMSDLMTKGQFETVEGKLVSDVYNKWRPGEPNNDGGQHCVTFYKSGNGLDDDGCHKMFQFICKKRLQSLKQNNSCNVSDAETEKSLYKLHTSAQTWADAKRACVQEGAILWHPDNDDEMHAVMSYWNTALPKLVFVGMSDLMTEGQFETVEGKVISDVYNKWRPGEPNNDTGQDCVTIYKSGNGLDDDGCHKMFQFICKKRVRSPKRNNSCNDSDSGFTDKKFFRKDYTYIESEESFYKIHMIERTFTDAKRMCDLEGAMLYYAENVKEVNAVASFWNRTQPWITSVFVGLTDRMAEGLFETVDGRPIFEVYSKWQSSQPDNFRYNEDCVQMDQAGTMRDSKCDSQANFICKKTLQSLTWNQNCNMSNLDYTYNKDIGKCYKLHTTPMNWTDAYAMCRTELTSLAMISNQMEAEYLGRLMESTPKPRVPGKYQKGLYHVGFHNRFNEGWQTVAGTPMNVDADLWFDGNKPDENNYEECISMFFNGLLINTSCNMKSLFICEQKVIPTSNATSELSEENYMLL